MMKNYNNKKSNPFLVDAKEAGRLLGISRSQFLAIDKSGRLGPESVNLGYGSKRQCRRWSVKELHQWTEHGCPGRQEWQNRIKKKE